VIVTVPEATPVTTPVVEPTVAIAVLLLLHVPPDVALLSVVILPGHTLAVPVMGDNGLFLKTETELAPVFATKMSGLLSPSISPIAT
jgi:hypothetical protein